MPLTREQIQKAIRCEDWQKLRVSLKGVSTQDKLDALERYLVIDKKSCCTDEDRRVQILNYLNALSRGGLIEPLSRDELFAFQFTDRVQARVRR